MLVSQALMFFYIFHHQSWCGLPWIWKGSIGLQFWKQSHLNSCPVVCLNASSDCQCGCSEDSALWKIFHRYSKHVWKLRWNCVRCKCFVCPFVRIYGLQGISEVSRFSSQGGGWHAVHKKAHLGSSLSRCNKRNFSSDLHQGPWHRVSWTQLGMAPITPTYTELFRTKMKQSWPEATFPELCIVHDHLLECLLSVLRTIFSQETAG